MRIFSVAMWIFIALTVPRDGFAQNLRLEQVTYSGVVKRVQNNYIQFESDRGMVMAECLLPSGNQQQLALSEFGATRINVRGHEATEFLQKGMFARFEADVARGARITEPVTEITIISRQNFTQLGMEPAGGALPDRRDGDALKGDDEEADDEEGTTKRSNTERMLITGQVTMVDEEKFRVEIPDGRRGRTTRKLVATWGKDAVVRIDTQEIGYIQPGDRVTVVGYTIRGLEVMATSVEAEHINPDVTVAVKEDGAKPADPAFPNNNGKMENPGEAAKANEQGEKKNAVDANGRAPRKNRPPGRVFKIN